MEVIHELPFDPVSVNFWRSLSVIFSAFVCEVSPVPSILCYIQCYQFICPNNPEAKSYPGSRVVPFIPFDIIKCVLIYNPIIIIYF